MQSFQRELIDYSIQCGVLRFGDFTLKSGRKSPYFFNTGLFDSGMRLSRLGEFYAQAYVHAGIQANVLYGPAYKGIPLACSASIALSRLTGEETPFAFNRKEPKDHGEGGLIVGAALKGRVLIIDDVITAGTSVRESVDIIRQAGATPAGVLIVLDRQEKGTGDRSAIEEVVKTFGMPVHAIVRLTDIIEYLEAMQKPSELASLREYREQYGA